MREGLHIHQSVYEMDSSAPVVSTDLDYDATLPPSYVRACIDNLLVTLKDLLERVKV